MGGFVSSYLCVVVGVVYPSYASFKALETDGKDDDTQWLIYWVVYSAFGVIETFADTFLSWFPFYYETKLALLIALQIPQLKLAPTIYNTYLRPFLKKHETEIDNIANETMSAAKNTAKDFAAKKGSDIMASAFQVASQVNQFANTAETKKSE